MKMQLDYILSILALVLGAMGSIMFMVGKNMGMNGMNMKMMGKLVIGLGVFCLGFAVLKITMPVKSTYSDLVGMGVDESQCAELQDPDTLKAKRREYGGEFGFNCLSDPDGGNSCMVIDAEDAQYDGTYSGCMSCIQSCGQGQPSPKKPHHPSHPSKSDVSCVCDTCTCSNGNCQCTNCDC